MVLPGSESYQLVAKTVSGLEQVLAHELEALGAEDIRLLTRAVEFSGDRELVYKVNYLSRLSLRVLKPIYRFTASNERMLYQGIRDIRWWEFFSPDVSFAIDAVCSGTVFKHSLFVAQKAKDAIVDQFRDKYATRPSVDLSRPDFRINVHIQGKDCTVSLDSSGRSLHKRGYRVRTHDAPLSEVLAAGILSLSGWDKKLPVMDFMCGSATILIEAALLAGNIAPGKFTGEFGFMHWADYDATVWKRVQNDAKAEEQPLAIPPLYGSDSSMQSISYARANIAAAGLEGKIQLERKDFRKISPPAAPAFLITNPPYGERLSVDDITRLYQDLGDVLKRNYEGWKAWIISGDLTAIKYIGLRPSYKYTVFNGPLECRLAGFDLYKGSKRARAQVDGD